MISGMLQNFGLLDDHINERISLNPIFRGVRDIDNEEVEDFPKEIVPYIVNE